MKKLRKLCYIINEQPLIAKGLVLMLNEPKKLLWLLIHKVTKILLLVELFRNIECYKKLKFNSLFWLTVSIRLSKRTILLFVGYSKVCLPSNETIHPQLHLTSFKNLNLLSLLKNSFLIGKLGSGKVSPNFIF